MKSTTPSRTSCPSSIGVCLRSDDGRLEFRLAPCGTGLFVERVEQRPRHARVAQATIFHDAPAFDRWCNADAVRFEYPVLYVALRRNADRVLR